MTSTVLYESDFYNWTVEQVKRLRLGKLDDLDLENLAEEIESLGNQKKSELENRLGGYWDIYSSGICNPIYVARVGDQQLESNAVRLKS